jgi:hypothetical protein
VISEYAEEKNIMRREATEAIGIIGEETGTC